MQALILSVTRIVI